MYACLQVGLRQHFLMIIMLTIVFIHSDYHHHDDPQDHHDNYHHHDHHDHNDRHDDKEIRISRLIDGTNMAAFVEQR